MFDQIEGVSCWSTSTRTGNYPALTRPVDVDAVVIGGGVAGITAAYLLKQRGKRVALLERSRWGSGQTGRTTAHVTAVPDVPLARLVDRLGVESARAFWDAGIAAIARIRAAVRDERINCEFSWVRGCLYAAVHQTAARSALGQEATVANAIGIPATYTDSVAGLGRPGVWLEGQARIHPLRYLSVLVDRIDGDGSYVFEQTEVDEVDATRRTVRARGITLAPEFIVLATHVPMACVTDEGFRAGPPVDLATSYVISGTAQPGVLEEGIYWEHRDPAYEYLRIDRHETHDAVIFGGMDHAGAEAAAAPDRFARLERCLAQYVPGVRVEHRWSGQIVDAPDGRPYIGEITDGVFIATAFGGNGMTFGTLAGMMAGEAACGEPSPWHDLFDPRRANAVVGSWGLVSAGGS